MNVWVSYGDFAQRIDRVCLVERLDLDSSENRMRDSYVQIIISSFF